MNRIPFGVGSGMHIAISTNLSKQDFIALMTISERGHLYSPQEQEALWNVVQAQRLHLKAHQLIDAGVFRAFNPALASLT